MNSTPPPTVDDGMSQRDYAAPSVFTPENMLRYARLQKGLPEMAVPEICLLDPDGDIVRRLREAGRLERHPGWACYHTQLDVFALDGEAIGIVGCAVGASFAVLVAEQLFADGCRFLLSVTSAGAIAERTPGSCFILIDRALRDEGTSAHYLPPAGFVDADPGLIAPVMAALSATPARVRRGTAWTTDAPFRETERAIARAHALGALAVEMEAAALYAFAAARGRAVLCVAHVTNEMARKDGDFDKGEADGTTEALAIVAAATRAWRGLGAVRAAIPAA